MGLILNLQNETEKTFLGSVLQAVVIVICGRGMQTPGKVRLEEEVLPVMKNELIEPM